MSSKGKSSGSKSSSKSVSNNFGKVSKNLDGFRSTEKSCTNCTWANNIEERGNYYYSSWPKYLDSSDDD